MQALSRVINSFKQAGSIGSVLVNKATASFSVDKNTRTFSAEETGQ
jgi:hypothetical protein